MESSKESKGSSTFSATLPFGKAPPMEETYPNVPKYYYIKYEDGLGVDDAPTASLPECREGILGWFCEKCFLNCFHLNHLRRPHPKCFEPTSLWCGKCGSFRHTRKPDGTWIANGNVRGIGPITADVSWECFDCSTNRNIKNWVAGSDTTPPKIPLYRDDCPTCRKSYKPGVSAKSDKRRRRLQGGVLHIEGPDVTYSFLCLHCAANGKYRYVKEHGEDEKQACTEKFQKHARTDIFNRWRAVEEHDAIHYFNARFEELYPKEDRPKSFDTILNELGGVFDYGPRGT